MQCSYGIARGDYRRVVWESNRKKLLRKNNLLGSGKWAHFRWLRGFARRDECLAIGTKMSCEKFRWFQGRSGEWLGVGEEGGGGRAKKNDADKDKEVYQLGGGWAAAERSVFEWELEEGRELGFSPSLELIW
jgi:hypothetical protein